MKTRFLVGVILLAILSVQGITTRRMEADITGISDELCANESVSVVVYDEDTGRLLNNVDVDVYYGKKKVENLMTNRSGFTSFVPVSVGSYRISLDRTRYRDEEYIISAKSCIVETTTTSTLCPDAPTPDSLLEENCLSSGGTTVEITDESGCVTSVECECPYDVGGNWTCLPAITTSTTITTTTLDPKEQADIYYNKSLEYFNTGDYNKTREFIEKACDIYQQLKENKSLEDCQTVLKSLEEAVVPTTTVVTTTLPVEKPNSRGRIWILIVMIIIGLVFILTRQKPKGITKLGGEPKSLDDRGAGTTLGEV